MYLQNYYKDTIIMIKQCTVACKYNTMSMGVLKLFVYEYVTEYYN